MPAAGRGGFTRLYDPVMSLSMRESSWRRAMVERVDRDLPKGGTLVDVGSGTGTFSVEIAGSRLDATIVGIDGDLESISLAKAKSGSDRVRWIEGLATDIPLEDERVDVVSMSLLLHHLSPDTKVVAVAEAKRILRPGGHLHIADWGRPDPVTFAGFQLLRLLDGIANTRDHAEGKIPALITSAGFKEVSTWRRLRTVWGSMEFITAEKSQ